ncbi:MAG: hypothetical protein ACK4UX_08210 [Thiobacillus sp.]
MSNKTLIATALGTAFAAGMAAAPIASAAENPFALTGLSSGYQVADNHAAKPASKPAEGKCGSTAKMKDGKCGEGKCGSTAKMKDGKCGEGKCGGAKAQGDAKKAEPGKTSTEKQ